MLVLGAKLKAEDEKVAENRAFLGKVGGGNSPSNRTCSALSWRRS